MFNITLNPVSMRLLLWQLQSPNNIFSAELPLIPAPKLVEQCDICALFVCQNISLPLRISSTLNYKYQGSLFCDNLHTTCQKQNRETNYRCASNKHQQVPASGSELNIVHSVLLGCEVTFATNMMTFLLRVCNAFTYKDGHLHRDPHHQFTP